MKSILLFILTVLLMEYSFGQITMETYQADTSHNKMIQPAPALKEYSNAELKLFINHNSKVLEIKEYSGTLRRPVGEYSYEIIASDSIQIILLLTDKENVKYNLHLHTDFSEFSMTNGIKSWNKPIVSNYSGSGLQVLADDEFKKLMLTY